MILLNFSHPLTGHQREQLEQACGQAIARVVAVGVQCDHARPFAEQATALVDAVGLSPEEWQTEPVLVVAPALAPIACACLAELHGRMGYFPPVVRLRPREGRTPPMFDVAEILDLQRMRGAARGRR